MFTKQIQTAIVTGCLNIMFESAARLTTDPDSSSARIEYAESAMRAAEFMKEFNIKQVEFVDSTGVRRFCPIEQIETNAVKIRKIIAKL